MFCGDIREISDSALTNKAQSQIKRLNGFADSFVFAEICEISESALTNTAQSLINRLKGFAERYVFAEIFAK